MAGIQVLCPNGRRQNVKVTPNTKILQVLEEVCKKQGFMPPEDYDLIHGIGRKKLDVTLSVRYANLPNNAKLEMVKSQNTRSEEDVLIALQIESGDRLQEKFSPQTSLWDILIHWENKPESAYKGVLTMVDSSSVPPTQPVCIYMREEVIGELLLKDTTLRKLGLTGGKAVIRLVHRPVDDTIMAGIINKLEKEQTKSARLDKIAKQKSQTDTASSSESSKLTDKDSLVSKSSAELNSNLPQQSKSASCSSTEPMDVESVTPDSVSMDTSQPRQLSPMDTENGSIDRNNQPVSSQIIPSSSKRGTDTHPANEPTACGSRQTPSSQAGIEALRQMNIPGLEIITPQDFHDLTPEEQEVARKLAARYMPGMGLSQAPRSLGNTNQPVKPKRQKTPFADFKFPESTKGKDLYHNEFSSVKKEDFQPCDREAVVFTLAEEISSPTTSELPEDFFEVTENDIKKMLVDQQRKVRSMEEQPLMTTSLRDAQKTEKYDKYKRVVIRIQFPDKLVLQGLFRPRETVFAIQKFVKSYLEDKNLEFYLYTAPPKCVLRDPSLTLIEASLVPASVVYFGAEQKKEHYLSEAVLKEIGSRSDADKIVDSSLGTPSSESDTQVAGGSNSSTPGASGTSQPKPRPKQNSSLKDAKDGDKGVPKWFKIGKK